MWINNPRMQVITKRRLLSLILAVLGIFLIVLSIYPIIEYEYISRKRFPGIVSPVSQKERRLILSAPFKDFGKLNNWSTEYELLPSNEVVENEYYISVPKLGINKAVVHEGGEDLSESLIQYPGTALPGYNGDTVIFGHSVLPVFFNPVNYMTIFSTLPKLEEGDVIIVNIGDVMYKYVVISMYEVYPNDLDILDQRLNDSYLSLVTCVPPGHPLKPKRLVVKAKLTQI